MEDQLTVTVVPMATEAGVCEPLMVMVAVGAVGSLGGLTPTVTLAEAGPYGPVQFKVYVAAEVRGPVVSEPEVGYETPLIVQEVTLVELQVAVEAVLYATGFGLALMVAVGVGVTATLTVVVHVATLPEPPNCSSRALIVYVPADG